MRRRQNFQRKKGRSKLKYVVSYDTEFGFVSVESENPEELVSAHAKLRQIADRLSGDKSRSKRTNVVATKRTGISRAGANSRIPETTAVLRELESTVLNSKFFEQPKTTRETREKIHDLTGKYFASRKVSQALGILRNRGKLKRKGKKNFFQYSLA